MKILKAIYISSKEEIVSSRLQVINFQLRDGTKATQEAYKISRATIFRWKKRYKEANFDVEALMDKSKVPKKKRKREVPKEVEDFVMEYRERHPGVGKEAIKCNLDFFCEEKRCKPEEAGNLVQIDSITKFVKRVKTGIGKNLKKISKNTSKKKKSTTSLHT